jgi:hypothetical protein
MHQALPPIFHSLPPASSPRKKNQTKPLHKRPSGTGRTQIFAQNASKFIGPGVRENVGGVFICPQNESMLIRITMAPNPKKKKKNIGPLCFLKQS